MSDNENVFSLSMDVPASHGKTVTNEMVTIKGASFCKTTVYAKDGALIEQHLIRAGKLSASDSSPKYGEGDWDLAHCAKHGRVYVKWAGCSMCSALRRSAEGQ